jgi:hypothetical protein
MTTSPLPRWGVRFTSDPLKRQQFVQDLYDDDNSNVKRGELFLNEVAEEAYYVGLDGVARTINGTTPVSFSRINFTGIREFEDDLAAAAATPAIAIGGLYHTDGVLKIRVS